MTEKKRISSDVFHISTSVQRAFFLLSAVVWPWSRYSSEHREKWKHVYIFFLLHARTQHSSHGQRWNRALKLNCSLKTKGCCDYGSVIIIFFSQRPLFYGLADEDSECWIFPQLWLLNCGGDGRKAPIRCQTEATMQPTISPTFCRIFPCMWYVVRVQALFSASCSAATKISVLVEQGAKRDGCFGIKADLLFSSPQAGCFARAAVG